MHKYLVVLACMAKTDNHRPFMAYSNVVVDTLYEGLAYIDIETITENVRKQLKEKGFDAEPVIINVIKLIG